MSKKFLTPLGLVSLASNPATGSEGDLYFNTTDDVVKVYANGAWTELTGGGGGASVIYTANQPDITGLEVGTIWVDSDAEAVGGGGGGGGTGLSFWSEDNIGNLIPDSSNVQSIGSLQYPVKDIFLSASSIYLGNTKIISNGSTLIVGSNELLNSSTASTVYATKTQLNNINLSSAITTASAAAYSSASAYTNSQIANINLSSAIQTASAAAVTYLVDSAPGALDTLNELAAALNDDANFGTTVTNSLAAKLNSSTASTIYMPLSSSASFYRWTKTYSASASVISGVDDNSISLSYNAGYIQLFINGVMLDPSEYTATNGTSITVTTPVLSGEVVDIFAFLNSTSVNTYSQAQINQKYNNLTRWKKVYTIPGNESFTVTNSGTGAYVVGGVNNPTFNLVKGNTYTFVVNATSHPFWIQTIFGAYSSGNVYSTGTTNLGTDNGTITWTVPTNAPDTLYYACQYHSSMKGTINLLDPAKIQGSDDNSLALSYTSGYEQVYLNGILLTPITDYARTSASVITLGSGVVTSDVIEIINTQPFNVADVYTTSQANSTFLTQSSASTTYLTPMSASTTYLTQSSASTVYRTINSTGLVKIIPTSVAVGSGTGSVSTTGTVTFSGASSVSLNNVFSSTYDHYRFVFTTTSNTAGGYINLRLRSTGTDVTTANYFSSVIQGAYGSSALGNDYSGNSTTTWSRFGYYDGTTDSLGIIGDIILPYATAYTSFNNTRGRSGYGTEFGTGVYKATTSVDGITIYSAGNFTGTLSVYGYTQ